MVDESEGYIAGAVPPEVNDAIGDAVDWLGEKGREAVDWAGQEVTDIRQTIGQGIDATENFVEEHREDLLM